MNINWGKIVKILLKYVWVALMLSLVFETYFYPGVLKNHLEVPLIIAITVGVAFVYCFYRTKKVSGKIGRAFDTLNKVVLFVLIFAAFFLTLLEYINYPNYVFSNFHLHLGGLYLMVLVGLLYFVITDNNLLGQAEKVASSKLSYKKYFLVPKITSWVELERVIITLFLFIIAISNLFSLEQDIARQFRLTKKYIFSSYDEKMRSLWGDFYNYMIFVKSYTSEDAIIYFPLRTEVSGHVNNPKILRYFLYPRKLVPLSIVKSQEIKAFATHSLLVGLTESKLVSEKTHYSWPFMNFENVRVMVFDEDVEVESDYRSDNEFYKKERGLIEL